MWIRQKAHVEYEVRIRGNSIAKSKAHHGHHQRTASWILEALDDELAQLVNVELRGVDHHVGHATDRRHSPALLANALEHRYAAAQRMRAARFAEASGQGLVVGFEEHKLHGLLAAQTANNARQFFDLLAFASVHKQSGALNFAAAFLVA